MKWITRNRPKIDRIACPWLIKRFIDPEAEIIYAPFEQVLQMSAEMDAIPFDIAGVEYTHYQTQCTFDYFLKKHQIKDKALDRIAAIVRGADTDRHDIAPQSAGLEAIFSGLSYQIKDDNELLKFGMVIYDGLYNWASHLYHLKHTQAGPAERLLLDIYHKYLKNKTKKAPAWINELKEMIQDQIDTNMALSLQQISSELALHPAYLSREFSKHFDNMSFGDYIRKMRIEKSRLLIESTGHTLTEIAYLTGFSDQAHFSRIFKLYTGQTPSAFKKSLAKK